MLARDIALNSREVELDKDFLGAIVSRIIEDAWEIVAIKTLISQNMENCRQILRQIEKSILLAEFNQRYLAKFVTDGTLSKEDMLSFYAGEDVKDQFRIVERGETYRAPEAA